MIEEMQLISEREDGLIDTRDKAKDNQLIQRQRDIWSIHTKRQRNNPFIYKKKRQRKDQSEHKKRQRQTMAGKCKTL